MAAFKLLEYLSTDEIQVDYVQKGVDLLPLKKGIASLPDIDPHRGRDGLLAG